MSQTDLATAATITADTRRRLDALELPEDLRVAADTLDDTAAVLAAGWPIGTDDATFDDIAAVAEHLARVAATLPAMCAAAGIAWPAAMVKDQSRADAAATCVLEGVTWVEGVTSAAAALITNGATSLAELADGSVR